eukprot:3026541-Pyramimonas_sp.AAC.1
MASPALAPPCPSPPSIPPPPPSVQKGEYRDRRKKSWVSKRCPGASASTASGWLAIFANEHASSKQFLDAFGKDGSDIPLTFNKFRAQVV